MSQLEVAQVSSPIYAYTFAPLVAGTISTTNVSATYNASPLANFRPQTSRILGVYVSAVGGVVGATAPMLTVVSSINSTADGYLPVITLRAPVITDTSTYVLYWTNEVAGSQYKAIQQC
jgi:hypothetical protein